MRTTLALLALLLGGCAQPAPFFPKPAEPGPVAAVTSKAEPTATPAPRGQRAGEVRLVGELKDEPACAACTWSLGEILAFLAAAAALGWGLVRLYRKKAE